MIHVMTPKGRNACVGRNWSSLSVVDISKTISLVVVLRVDRPLALGQDW